RFSGGSIYIDTLANILQVPVQDFAIGGAFGGTNSGTLCFDSFYAPGTSPLCGKGLQYEIDQFLNVGTQSAVFPNAATTFTPGDPRGLFDGVLQCPAAGAGRLCRKRIDRPLSGRDHSCAAGRGQTGRIWLH